VEAAATAMAIVVAVGEEAEAMEAVVAVERGSLAMHHRQVGGTSEQRHRGRCLQGRGTIAPSSCSKSLR